MFETGPGLDYLNGLHHMHWTTLATLILGIFGPAWSECVTNSKAAADSTTVDGRTYLLHDGLYFDEAGKAWRPVTATVTAYAPTRDQCDEDPDVTATGTNAFTTFGVAADPRAIAYGTMLRIPGYGEARVDDTGSAMRRAWRNGAVHLDVRIPLRGRDGAWRSEGQCTRIAMNYGRKSDVTVLIRSRADDLTCDRVLVW